MRLALVLAFLSTATVTAGAPFCCLFATGCCRAPAQVEAPACPCCPKPKDDQPAPRTPEKACSCKAETPVPWHAPETAETAAPVAAPAALPAAAPVQDAPHAPAPCDTAPPDAARNLPLLI